MYLAFFDLGNFRAAPRIESRKRVEDSMQINRQITEKLKGVKNQKNILAQGFLAQKNWAKVPKLKKIVLKKIAKFWRLIRFQKIF